MPPRREVRSETAQRQYVALLGEIRAARARMGWSDSELGRRLGWTQAMISRRMTGDQPFTVTELLDVCAMLNVRLDDLAADARKHSAPVPAMRTAGGQVTGDWLARDRWALAA